jgi:Bacterial capsule synthesis protein PGA_cap
MSPSPVRVAVSAADLHALCEDLGVTPRNIRALSPDAVRAFVRSTPNALGIVRADDVALGVRAIGVDGLQLFGVGHVRYLAEWPLLAAEPGVTTTFTTSDTWTLAAGGDVMLDKAVYARSVTVGLGVDYAWNGGTAAIEARYCCGWGGSSLVSGLRTGQSGALGDLFRQADVSMINLESPEPHDYTYHADGFTFTGDPTLLAGLQDAGIDVVSLANNHLGDGGLHAVADEIGSLDSLGIAHIGAGANNSAARAPAWVMAGGLRVAVLAYCWIQPLSYWATSNSPGSSGFSIWQVGLRRTSASRRRHSRTTSRYVGSERSAPG